MFSSAFTLRWVFCSSAARRRQATSTSAKTHQGRQQLAHPAPRLRRGHRRPARRRDRALQSARPRAPGAERSRPSRCARAPAAARTPSPPGPPPRGRRGRPPTGRRAAPRYTAASSRRHLLPQLAGIAIHLHQLLQQHLALLIEQLVTGLHEAEALLEAQQVALGRGDLGTAHAHDSGRRPLPPRLRRLAVAFDELPAHPHQLVVGQRLQRLPAPVQGAGRSRGSRRRPGRRTPARSARRTSGSGG